MIYIIDKIRRMIDNEKTNVTTLIIRDALNEYYIDDIIEQLHDDEQMRDDARDDCDDETFDMIEHALSCVCYNDALRALMRDNDNVFNVIDALIYNDCEYRDEIARDDDDV